MSLQPTYDPKIVEPRLQNMWEEQAVYRFDRNSKKPVYAIDTPPATVSGSASPGAHLFV